jgi:hypothetical protein
MQSVRYKGITVAVPHPAVWIDRGEQIVRDLVDVFTHRDVSLQCLRHLIANRHRLISGVYQTRRNRGCLMFILTEPLESRQVRTKAELTRFFGQTRGRAGMASFVAAKDSPEYQPAKWLVRLVDAQYCEHVRARYGRACEFFDYDLVLAVARQVLAQREAIECSVPTQTLAAAAD